MSLVLNCNQIRELENKAVGFGMSWLRLMENAGSAAAKEIRDCFNETNIKIVVVCGKGNNGGDGFVIARKLIEKFSDVKIITIGIPSTDSSKEMYSKALGIGLKPIQFDLYESLCTQYITEADVVIDAIFGIGLKGDPDPRSALAINAINSCKGSIISVDVPSGLQGDIGTVGEHCVKADSTITFSAYKPCQLLNPSSMYCGEVKLVTIGIPKEAYYGLVPDMQVVNKSNIIPLLPVRDIDCHKGSCGTAGLFVGNIGMAGAAVLAGKAAIKSGVGIANMIIPEGIYNIVGSSIPEAVCTILKGDSYESIHESDCEKIITALNKGNCGLIGCGLGKSKHIKSILKQILHKCTVPLVIDADGINQLTDCIELLRQYKYGIVLTPHPKEASRLLGCTVEEVQSDRLSSARKITARTNAVTIFKGAKTLIVCPNGNTYIVTDGNPGMATAGTGDMLAGMIVSFVAQGLTLESSAMCAVKIHAMAGDEAVRKTSMLSLTPTDMINTLPEIYCKLYSKK